MVDLVRVSSNRSPTPSATTARARSGRRRGAACGGSTCSPATCCTLRADGAVDRMHVGDVAAFLRPRTNGGWVVATERGLARADEADGIPTPWFDLWDDPSVRMNEGGVDGLGRLWAGTMGYDRVPGSAALYRVDRAGCVTVVLPDVTISNGIDLSPDGRLAYYDDTPTGRTDVFDVVDGELMNRRPFVTHDVGHPDGLTVDSAGNVWVALNGAGRVRCFSPAGERARRGRRCPCASSRRARSAATTCVTSTSRRPARTSTTPSPRPAPSSASASPCPACRCAPSPVEGATCSRGGAVTHGRRGRMPSRRAYRLARVGDPAVGGVAEVDATRAGRHAGGSRPDGVPAGPAGPPPASPEPTPSRLRVSRCASDSSSSRARPRWSSAGGSSASAAASTARRTSSLANDAVVPSARAAAADIASAPKRWPP